jgi:hypothetical protein
LWNKGLGYDVLHIAAHLCEHEWEWCPGAWGIAAGLSILSGTGMTPKAARPQMENQTNTI